MLRAVAPEDRTSLNIWDRLEIVVEHDNNRGVYITRIEDIKGTRIIASKPEFIEGNCLLKDNSRAYIQVLRQDALYRLPVMIQMLDGSPGGMIQLYARGNFERVQRRDFVRIDLKVDLKYAPVKGPSWGLLVDRPCWFSSYSRNISAGGMLMKVGDNITRNDILMVRVGNYEMMGVPRLVTVFCCRILRIDDGNFAGVQFITGENLSKHFSRDEIKKLPAQVKSFKAGVQNKLVRFIFDQQVKERQKGLI